ncbi:hypothetical protein MIND_00811100 [Mycena indigotica]|uniref:Uncharacterized protein n=1 Tax=Mycena indigotica TaxID=2126181 RepID=A0A8H6SFI2_9AGAR|nr:uncharacterized protein MIND_00811100 [Mycena indigotica]KAF7298640.1 hypothetical protein MIND_00811100 [Mycena indigotica]
MRPSARAVLRFPLSSPVRVFVAVLVLASVFYLRSPESFLRGETRKAPGPPVLLKGFPTRAFADNLRPDVQYITTWVHAGFTNDVIIFIHLLYLALLTQRVPIIPHFVPTHILGPETSQIDGFSGPDLDFGEVFDLPRYSRLTNQAVLEWWQVKDRESDIVDPLGCWEALVTNKHHRRASPHRLKLDVSYTTAPNWTKISSDPHNPHLSFSALMALTFPTKRNQHLIPPTHSPLLNHTLPPNEHLFCFDNLYWVCEIEEHDLQYEWSAAWRLVGQHLHWTPQILSLSDDYLRHAFGLEATNAPIPPFIAVHVRRGDFADPNTCDKFPSEECYAPISFYHMRVKEMQAELLASNGVVVQHVLLMSDEQDETWWAQAQAAYSSEGWARASHVELQTVEKYGMWYPILIDSAMQTHRMVLGIVGTMSSTVSVISGKRIASWNEGTAPLKMVPYGQWIKENLK